MKAEYRVFRGQIFDEEKNIHMSYGIELWKNGELARRISDVSVDSEGLHELVRLCNELELDPVHLDDVVEDFVG